MARQTRQRASSTPGRTKAKPPQARRKLKAAVPSSQLARSAVPARPRPSGTGSTKPARPALAQTGPAAQRIQTPPPRKPQYYEALAMYESGVRALQRHDYEGAAAHFRSIIERYPDERELQERSQLYLRVCERETARRPPSPQTPQERVYAATVALNAGETAAAVDHLRRALAEAPDSDHAHYIMSVALASNGDAAQALTHLRQAVALNPENRALAMQDPDLEQMRGVEGFRELLDGPLDADGARNKPRKRR